MAISTEVTPEELRSRLWTSIKAWLHRTYGAGSRRKVTDYAALLPMLLSYIADGKLKAKFEAYSSHPVPTVSARSTGSAALLATALEIWGDESRLSLFDYLNPELVGMLDGSMKTLSQQAALDHRRAAMYTQDLLTCLRELPAADATCLVESSLTDLLWFLCKACTTRRSILSMSVVLLDEDASAHVGLSLQLDDASDPSSSQVQVHWQGSAAERLHQEHLEDVEVMSRLLEEVKRASSLSAACKEKEDTDYLGPLTPFVYAPTALARRNADWLFKNGAELISKLFVASESVYVYPRLFELLLRRQDAEIPQDKRSSTFARLGVLNKLIEGCKQITPRHEDFAKEWLRDGVKAMSHFLKNSAVRKAFPAARVLDYLWRMWLPEAIVKVVNDPPDSNRTSSSTTAMSKTSLQVLEFLVELAPHVHTSRPPEARPCLEVDSGLVACLMRACVPDNLQKAGVNIGRLLFRLMDPPEGGIGVIWTAGSFIDCFQILLKLWERVAVWERPERITAHMATMFEAYPPNQSQLQVYMDNQGHHYWSLWAIACRDEDTLLTRSRALAMLSAIIKAALEPNNFPSSRLGLSRDELILQTRRKLGKFAPEFAAELLDGREGMRLAEQRETLATLSQLCDIISQVYEPEFSVLSATDEEKDILLDYCCGCLELASTDELRRAQAHHPPSAAQHIHLSRAVAVLVRGSELGPGGSLAAARDSPSVTAASELCKRFHRDEDGQAYRGYNCRTLAVDKLTSTFRSGKGEAMALAMTAMGRFAYIAALGHRNCLKKRGLTAFEETQVNWTAVLQWALSLAAVLDTGKLEINQHLGEARIDAACLTDILAPAFLHSRDSHTAGLQAILTCYQKTVPHWASAQQLPASLTHVLKSLVEAHIALAKVVPEPQLWASGCRQTWEGVLRLKVKLKLPAAVLGRIGVLLRQLDAVEAAQEAAHEAAMKALLDEVEAESRQQEAKKAKKKSKQAARKQKAQASKTATPVREPAEEIAPAATPLPSAAQDVTLRSEANIDVDRKLPANTSAADDALGPQPSASPLAHGTDAQERAAAPETDQIWSTSDFRAEGYTSSLSIASSLPEITAASSREDPAAAVGPSHSAASTSDGYVRLGGAKSTTSSKSTRAAPKAVLVRPRPAPPTAERVPPRRPDGEGVADLDEVALATSSAQLDNLSVGASASGHEIREAGLLESLEEICTCPITQELFQDPVTAADGFTYERSVIEEWLRKSATSPMTGGPLPSLQLQPNLLVRQMLSTLLGQQGWQGSGR